MQSEYDVIVVGGRVAGSATALLLARMGHRVLIIDRADPTRETLSTHAIMRSGVLQLQRWGVLSRILDRGTPPIRHISLGFGQRQIGFDFRAKFGVNALYAPRRYILDEELLAAALAAGATFRQGRRLVDLLYDSRNRVSGVEVDAEGRQSSITVRFVVGADGMRSRVAAAVGGSGCANRSGSVGNGRPRQQLLSFCRFAWISTCSRRARLGAGRGCRFYQRPAVRPRHFRRAARRGVVRNGR